jgi:hypothetical protein
MSLENQGRKNSLSLKTLGLLHRYLDDFVLVRKARRGELFPVELEGHLRQTVASSDEIQEILSEYKRFHSR